MRIGIDAKWYFDGPPSGKRVVRSLVDHMLEIDDKNEYFIFLNSKHQGENFPGKDKRNVTLCYVWAGNNLLSNVFVLPFYSAKFNLDALLYQNFVSPFDKSKTIAYIHDVLFLSNPEYYTVYERLYFFPLKYLTRRSGAIVTVSEEEKLRLMRFGFSDRSEKIEVAHHGVDSSFLPQGSYPQERIAAIKQQFELPDKFLLFVGRLNLRKNVDNLLRSIPLLSDKSIPLVIVGADNWKKSNHTQIIDQLGIANRIQFTGAIYQELGIVYSLSTVFCFPSFAESFGLPPLEAMACGIPVVVSNTTSLPEVCGSAGNYVTPDKPQEIAQAIDNLLGNHNLYAEKKRLGLEQASKFTWHNAARKVLSWIELNVHNKVI